MKIKDYVLWYSVLRNTLMQNLKIHLLITKHVNPLFCASLLISTFQLKLNSLPHAFELLSQRISSLVRKPLFSVLSCNEEYLNSFSV